MYEARLKDLERRQTALEGKFDELTQDLTKIHATLMEELDEIDTQIEDNSKVKQAIDELQEVIAKAQDQPISTLFIHRLR